MEPRGIEPGIPCENEQLSQSDATETLAGTGSMSGNVLQLTSGKSEFESDWAELAELGLAGGGEPTHEGTHPAVEPTPEPAPPASGSRASADDDMFGDDPVAHLTKAIVRATAAGQWDLATMLAEQLREVTKLHVRHA